MTLTSPDAVGAPPPERVPQPQPAGSNSIPDRCRALINNRSFELFIVGVIVINAIVLGMGTYADLASRHEPLFATIYNVILGIYVVELLIRLTAYRWNPREFVKDGWNIFDFIVVVASFVPALRANAMLLRMVRLLRIVRLVRFLPDLRVLVSAAGRSVPGIASLAAATFVLIFIYGMAGWVLFGSHDPANYGNVGLAMLTMFVMLTLENFPDNVAMGQEISQWTILFFISYVLLASFLIFNLFIGIVLNSMEEARAADRKEHEKDDLLERLRDARAALEDAERELQKAHRDDG
ncbi:ion transporter [Mycobacterium neglectum]|uniref:ion transporter n=1 Tax=Mycobacterium neglectum TaxID=242737 RepID=UPI000BFEE846|nr:ion transporter [Mycobacterium neglectum]